MSAIRFFWERVLQIQGCPGRVSDFAVGRGAGDFADDVRSAHAQIVLRTRLVGTATRLKHQSPGDKGPEDGSLAVAGKSLARGSNRDDEPDLASWFWLMLVDLLGRGAANDFTSAGRVLTRAMDDQDKLVRFDGGFVAKKAVLWDA